MIVTRRFFIEIKYFSELFEKNIGMLDFGCVEENLSWLACFVASIYLVFNWICWVLGFGLKQVHQYKIHQYKKRSVSLSQTKNDRMKLKLFGRKWLWIEQKPGRCLMRKCRCLRVVLVYNLFCKNKVTKHGLQEPKGLGLRWTQKHYPYNFENRITI